jgi:hypothetical protein
MKRLSIAVLALLLGGGEALAVTRRDVTNMNCEQIKALLRSEGSAILRFPASEVAGLKRYGLFISDRALCPALQTRAKRRVRGTDGSCFVSQCVENGQSLRLQGGQ